LFLKQYKKIEMQLSRYILISVLFLILSSFKIQKDDPYQFKKYINNDVIGIKQVEINQSFTNYETTFLGELKVGGEKLYALSQFYMVQTSRSRNGHSRIIFIDHSGKTKRIYILDMPDELPTQIADNKLKLGDLFFDEFGNELPQLICIPSGGCYE